MASTGALADAPSRVRRPWPARARPRPRRPSRPWPSVDRLTRILLIEDDPDDFELTRELLLELGERGHRYELEWATDYDSGRAAILREEHDVCVLDCRLGERDGLALLSELAGAAVRLPIIVLTGSGDGAVERRGLAAGAVDYLEKGELDAAILERSIRRALERGRSLDALRDRERQFRATFETSLDALVITDDEGRFVDGNDAALALLGLAREELPSILITDPAGGQQRGGPSAWWRSLLARRGADGELAFLRRDGEAPTVELRVHADLRPGRHLVVMRDVTARRPAEAHERRLAAIVESSADAIGGFTLEGVIDYWSPAAERLYGYEAHEVIGRPMRLVVPEDGWAELDAHLARIRGGESLRGIETRHRRKDGTIFAASVAAFPILQGGAPVGASLITRDLSERKDLETQLALSDRMVSLGTLAAGVMHEINNPLAAVLGNLECVSDALVELERGTAPAAPSAPSSGRSTGGVDPTTAAWLEHEVRAPLEDARSAAGRLRNVVRDLRLLSRSDEALSGRIDVRAAIESSLRMASNEIRHRAQVVRDYGEVADVRGDDSRLGQVLLNLLVNAAQAIGEGDAGRHQIRVSTSMDPEGRVAIAIRDTGEGMSSDVLARLFEPFFTTKPAGIGTGLGLSICRRLVHDLGGTIEVDSAVGRGTTFTLRLPAAPPRAASGTAGPAPTTAAVAASSVRRGRVLVVDDDPVIGRALQRGLAPAHDVTVTASVAEALELLRAAPAFDVILCDLMMPVMTGMDLHEALRRRMPDLLGRLVFLTGGAFTPGARDFFERVAVRKVDKPFSIADLRALVSEMTDGDVGRPGR